jgi:apolipoprotein D and lipocalin family protein
MPPRLRIARKAALAGLGLLLVACATAAPTTPAAAGPIDLARFMGRWHVIAHVPYFAERGHVESSDTYTLRPDGRIAVHYAYRTGFAQPAKSLDSVATVNPGSGQRDWTTWFFRVIPTRFRVLEVAPDYSWALIGYPGRQLAWVFAREPHMDDGLYADLRGRLGRHGVDVTALRRVPQRAGDVGKPGYAAPKSP